MQNISFVEIGIILVALGVIVLILTQAWLYLQIKKLKDDWGEKDN